MPVISRMEVPGCRSQNILRFSQSEKSCSLNMVFIFLPRVSPPCAERVQNCNRIFSLQKYRCSCRATGKRTEHNWPDGIWIYRWHHDCPAIFLAVRTVYFFTAGPAEFKFSTVLNNIIRKEGKMYAE
jgi:hypothetical protein